MARSWPDETPRVILKNDEHGRLSLRHAPLPYCQPAPSSVLTSGRCDASGAVKAEAESNRFGFNLFRHGGTHMVAELGGQPSERKYL